MLTTHNPLCPLVTVPGQIVGYVNGKPVRTIAGGSAPVPGAPAAPPAEPAAPATPPATPPAAPPAAPAAPPAQPPAATPKLDELLADLPEDVRKVVLDQVADARKDAAKYRTQRQTATQQAQQAEQQRNAILAALGIKPDGTPDVDPVQVAEQAQQQAREAQVALAVHTSAGKLGADPAKLLDSVSFRDAVKQSVTSKPGEPDFASQVDAAITAALTANPALKAGTAAVPPTSGTPLPGTPGEQAKRPASLGDALKRRRAITT